MLEKFPSDKINVTKYALFSLSRAHPSFTFDLIFLYELKRKVYLSKTVRGIFHFWIPFRFYYSFYLCSTKSRNFLTLKCHNSFQN